MAFTLAAPICTVLAVAGWLLYKERVLVALEVVERWSDRAMYWVLDKLLGEHKEYEV